MKNNDFMIVWRQRMSKVAVTAVKHVVWCLFGYRVEDVSTGHCFRAKVVALFGVLVSSGSNFVHFGIFRSYSCPDNLCSVSLLRSCHDLGLNIPQNLANNSPKKSQLHDANKQPAVTFQGFPLAVSLLGRRLQFIKAIKSQLQTLLKNPHLKPLHEQP